MPMYSPSLVTYILVVILVYLTYTAHGLKNKIWCSFRRKDRTKIEKWAIISKKGTWRDIAFDGGWYHVEPSRTVLIWKMFLGFFPMPVRGLDFRHDSSRALHPDTFENVFTPEEREQLNIADDVREFGEGSRQAVSGKQKKGMLENLMPIIMIGGFAVAGYLLYAITKKIDMLGNALNILQSIVAK